MHAAPPNSTVAGARVPVAVLASGTGSLLESLVAYADRTDAPFTIVAIAVDRECRAAELAREREVPVVERRLGDHPDRAAWDAALTDGVAEHDPQWIVTAGFMKILGPAFLGRFGGRIVNSHPALLPSFPGAHGVADALAHGVKVTGATVHLVDDGVDTGPILAQVPVTVEAGDTEATLHERIKAVERIALAEVVAALVTRGVVIDGRKAHIP
ncbi:phosphoribosylglycinamide formyltransferase [Gordonia soli]|uniref:Phosphoribosylglycinamide formyltransferase n=1 Tax=Gordonia soli NBRC 108243 TaxID=1223545 RepID=M0QPU1_9ACTN|nr:phosphoribosylglycinamide formyltransferase [Gordonia soli]GAC70384.1 glycinamide ribonucleotide transformylase PurN [Gordonia soli NBRC 108243]